MSTIDTIKSTISTRGGFARSNRFSIFMVPPARAFNDPEEGRDLDILCQAASLPGRQIQTFEHTYFKQQIKVASSYINQDVSFTFNLTSDYFIKSVFDKWSNLIIDRDLYKRNYDSDYRRDVTIYQNDIKNKHIHGVKLIGAYPISVQTVELDSGTADEVQQVTVEFTYIDFEEFTPAKQLPKFDRLSDQPLNLGGRF